MSRNRMVLRWHGIRILCGALGTLWMSLFQQSMEAWFAYTFRVCLERERGMVCLYLSHHHLHWCRGRGRLYFFLSSANGRMYVRSLLLWDDSNSNKFDKYQFTAK